MQRQATPIFFSAAGKCMPKKRARLKNFCINTDHLGNTRVSFQDADGNGSIDTENEVVETNDYYPFGLQHQKANQVVGGNLGQKFKYNGVELNETLDLYEMPFRQYDPAIARFTSIDPVIHYEYSTYSAFDNNPVFFADPSGANSTSFIMDIFNNTPDDGLWHHYNSEGEETGTSDPNEEECPDCDDKDILLNFIKDAAIQHAINMAKQEIHYAENPLDAEVYYEKYNSVFVQKWIKITGNNRLKYRSGSKNLVKYFTGGTADYNRYEFMQEFELLMKDGSNKMFSAKGEILIQAQESDMNLTYYGFSTSGVGLDYGHVINFFNGKGNLIARLSFSSESVLRAFENQYFKKPYLIKKNQIIKAYNQNKD